MSTTTDLPGLMTHGGAGALHILTARHHLLQSWGSWVQGYWRWSILNTVVGVSPHACCSVGGSAAREATPGRAVVPGVPKSS